MRNKLNNIKSIAKHNRTIIGNFSYLSAMSFINLLIPLATYPYLIRVLGKETYGIIIYAQAIIGYFVVIVSFGFNTSATKNISVNRYNKAKLNEIVSSVLIIKGLLLIAAFVLLTVTLNFIPQARGYYTLFFLSMWLALYDFSFPIWYFQGIEKMKYITYFTLISKLIFVSLIFIFIKSPHHYLRVPVINAIGALIAGACSLFIIFKQDKIKFKFQNLSLLRKYFKESFPLFLSSVSISIFVQANKVIIGSFIGMAEVAYYDLAEKIVQLLKTPQILVTQAIFPKTSKQTNIPFIKKMMILSLCFAIILFSFVQIFAYDIVTLLGGEHMGQAAKLLRLLSFAIIIVYISQYTSVHTLLANGFNYIWMNILLTSGLLYIALVIAFGVMNRITALNLVAITLISELYMLVSSYYYSKKLNLL